MSQVRRGRALGTLLKTWPALVLQVSSKKEDANQALVMVSINSLSSLRFTYSAIAWEGVQQNN